MKLKILFGVEPSSDIQILEWNKEINEFPRIIYHLYKNWSWIVYDRDDEKKYDYILTFAPIPSYDPEYLKESPTINQIGQLSKEEICGCGAEFTSFPNHHLPFCKLYKTQKW